MLKGLALFAEHFTGYQDAYIVIGGTACYLNLHEQGLEFRATKDIDIVLLVEALNPAFYSRFWEFINAGLYQVRLKTNGRPIFYRFEKPENPEYPSLLELFSQVPPTVDAIYKEQIAPLPSGDEASSLSAILLDEVYYEYLHQGSTTIQGIPVAKPECLIPLKAKAWLDLSERKARGEAVDSRNITKHLKDILSLFSILTPDEMFSLPEAIASDVRAFLKSITDSDNPLLKIKNGIQQLYGL